MAVLHNKTQDSFTIVANTILWDTKLKLADRGLLCTICGLPDKWDFSVAGLSAILPDGRDAITHGIQRLEQKGYLKRTTTHGKDGKFSSDVEVFPMGDANGVEMSQESHDGKTVTANPLRKNRYGKTVTDNQTQYNTNNKTLKINLDYSRRSRESG